MGAQGHRPDRFARPDPVRAGPAENPLRQDHAPHPAQDRRGRAGQPRRHLDAGRSRRGRRSRRSTARTRRTRGVAQSRLTSPRSRGEVAARCAGCGVSAPLTPQRPNLPSSTRGPSPHTLRPGAARAGRGSAAPRPATCAAQYPLRPTALTQLSGASRPAPARFPTSVVFRSFTLFPTFPLLPPSEPGPGPGVETVWLTHAVKNAWANRRNLRFAGFASNFTPRMGRPKRSGEIDVVEDCGGAGGHHRGGDVGVDGGRRRGPTWSASGATIRRERSW